MGCRALHLSGAAPDLLRIQQKDHFVLKHNSCAMELGNRLVFSRVSSPRGTELRFTILQKWEQECGA